MNNSDFIDLLKREKIAIFCAGLHGKLFYEILKACEIKVDCFIDNSEEKWGKTIIDDVLCVNPSVLSEKKYIVFVCVGRKYCKTITNEIVSNYQVEIYTITEFIDFLVQNNKELYFKVLFQHGLSESADLIFDLAANRRFVFRDKKVKFSSKIAVYTAVFGEYDSANYCKNFGDDVDLYFVSDMKPKNLPEYYKWLDAKTIIPPNIESPIKRNRYIKMKPHNFLGQYEYSIYIDGNVIIEGDLASFIRKSKSGISVFMHPARECIYHEAISIVNFKRVKADDVCKQMKRYMDEGMPSHYGLSEMPIIAREHKKSECVSVMEKWWEEFEKESQRDQLSFMYAMWKNNLQISDLGCLGYDVRNCKDVIFLKHSKESKEIKNDISI